jgi:hypothetical protein
MRERARLAALHCRSSNHEPPGCFQSLRLHRKINNRKVRGRSLSTPCITSSLYTSSSLSLALCTLFFARRACVCTQLYPESHMYTERQQTKEQVASITS